MSCASSNDSRPWICARPPPMPPERLGIRVVDLRERPDLAVEDDREVLRRAAQIRPRVHSSPVISSNMSAPLPVNSIVTIGQAAAARARVEVRARAVELQVLARHLRDLAAART